ncbi:unnamed protein product [Cladocopium goreaui]|uniref:Uncharacterized protein n=1 Tax=Cladocopium goreaui TaxID=2562237 RepID=A0A9P1C734_9DINO|nr:unnamed protein product [Cladocopium goreaui]
MAMTLAASMRVPAEGAALIQSSQPELGLGPGVGPLDSPVTRGRSAEIRESPPPSAFKEKAGSGWRPG